MLTGVDLVDSSEGLESVNFDSKGTTSKAKAMSVQFKGHVGY